ncbi:MAG: heme biosynthesis protein HemY [Nitrosomonadales bacterium]|nr:heme biosynthesis protein HemY [Nitrosomonadales bacterium]
MKLLVWFLVLAAAAVALTLASHNPGYVLLVYAPYRIELSLTLFTFGLFGLFVLSFLAAQLLTTALNLPEKVRQFRAGRAQEKKQSAMLEALTAFFEGRYAAAEKAATRTMELGEAPGVMPIIAARSAHKQREFERRDAYLASLETEPALRLLAKAQFMLDQQQPQSALEALHALEDSGVKNHIGAQHLEFKAQQMARNWDAVLELSAQLEKRDALDVTVAAQIKQQAWLEKVRAQRQDSSALMAVWKTVPGEFRHRAKIAATAARAFIELGNCRSAQQVLVYALEAQWDSELVALLGDCQEGDIVAQIEQAEKWLEDHTQDAGLLLALGKLCLNQGLWGKAQSYLDASLSIAPSSAAYNALGRLAEKLHCPEEAFKYYHQATGFGK